MLLPDPVHEDPGRHRVRGARDRARKVDPAASVPEGDRMLRVGRQDAEEMAGDDGPLVLGLAPEEDGGGLGGRHVDQEAGPWWRALGSWWRSACGSLVLGSWASSCSTVALRWASACILAR